MSGRFSANAGIHRSGDPVDTTGRAFLESTDGLGQFRQSASLCSEWCQSNSRRIRRRKSGLCRVTVRVAVVLMAFVQVLIPAEGSAHEMRPAYLEIVEQTSDTFDVTWKVPARGTEERLGLHIVFDDGTEPVGEPVSAFFAEAHLQRMRMKRSGGLRGARITIDGLSGTYTDVLVRMELLDGTELTHRLTPDSPTLEIETDPDSTQVAWTYFVLGVEHILFGIDHLLFVLALLLLVADWKRLVFTITAFTVAHSITLGLATLGIVNIPGPPVEATIALSIVFVAAEIVRSQQGHAGITERWPWLVSFTFGLLHGFGFAGALSEVGLPSSSIPIALLTFNLGVEAGQLMFVAVLLFAYGIAKLFVSEIPGVCYRACAYVIGSVASFWLIERTASFWSA